MITALDQLLDRLSRFYLRFSQLLLAGLVVAVFAQVIWRYLFARSFMGLEELTALALVWVVFPMSVVLHRRGRHICVSVLSDLFSPRLKRLAGIIISLGVITLVLFVLYQLWQVWPYLRLKSPVFGIPDIAFKIAPAFAFIPIALQELLHLAGRRAESRQPAS
ncbi:MAG: TRAP transporter small permease subunit [Rhodospirillales bacterium]